MLSAQHHEGVSYHLSITSLGKDQNLKFEVQFLLNEYSFHIIVKLQLCKWETVVLFFWFPNPKIGEIPPL